MRRQTLPELAATAHPQGGDAPDVGVELIERAELTHQRGRDLGPYARHARNVVGGIPGESQEVGEALGSHAEVALHVPVAELRAGTEVPQQVAVAYELGKILVARDEGRA